MPAPTPHRQKLAWTTIDRLIAEAGNVWVIHYSCEGIHDRVGGKSPRITSIAVRRLDSGQTSSFSIHQVAEESGQVFAEIVNDYDRLEKKMLDAFYDHVSQHRNMKYLHWNMRDTTFGFAAIEHRYRVLGGTPSIIEDERKVDLARLLIDIYGSEYAPHRRMETLLDMNGIRPPGFLTGKEEAEAFDKGNYVALHQSTLRKVDVMSTIVELCHARNLKTKAGWWEMHGGHMRSALDWMAGNTIFQVIVGIASIVGLVFTILALRTGQ